MENKGAAVASILVIDDDEALRLLLREMLEPDGHRSVKPPTEKGWPPSCSY
jgi:CheY-like chemotaxis protein